MQRRTVALAGNPNVGKSTLFNALTGLHQHTGNWPGKTVGIAQGSMLYQGIQYRFVDLPGTYALDGATEDEQLAGEYIRENHADCVVAVCDGSCLERNLILVLQMLPLAKRMVVCVNLMDEAENRGIRVDGEALEAALGVPVILTSAGRKRGLDALMRRIQSVCAGQVRQLPTGWDDPVAAAQDIAQRCVKTTQEAGQGWRRELDRFLVSRRHGISVMLLLLFFIIWLTVWGANYPSMLLEAMFDRGYVLLERLFVSAPVWLGGILLDGVYTTCTRVIAVMLPPMTIFFPLFTLLEDVGYLPRMAFLLDHSMCRCGGCGKQALTMCMGLGCNAVGVMGCRIIDSPRERLAAMLTNAMVPCNGRFPTLIILGSLFFPNVGTAFLVAAGVALGMTGAMVVSGVLSKTVLKGRESTFIMEIPPFRRPRLGQILVRSLLDRSVMVAMRAIKVAAPAGAVLWLLGNTGMMQLLARLLKPVGLVLGMNGIILLAFILSLPANELLIPIILMIETGMGSLKGTGDLANALLVSAGMTWQMGVCTMVFTLFHWPCSTTLMTIYRETGSMKKTAAAFILPTAVGIVLCSMLHLIL